MAQGQEQCFCLNDFFIKSSSDVLYVTLDILSLLPLNDDMIWSEYLCNKIESILGILWKMLVRG